MTLERIRAYVAQAYELESAGFIIDRVVINRGSFKPSERRARHGKIYGRFTGRSLVAPDPRFDFNAVEWIGETGRFGARGFDGYTIEWRATVPIDEIWFIVRQSVDADETVPDETP